MPLQLSLALAGILLASAAVAQEHLHARAQAPAPGYSALGFVPPAAGTYELPPLGLAAGGAVIDSDGRRQTLQELLGDKLVVLSFIYTTCSDVNGCPLASFVLAGLQRKLLADPALGSQVRLVSLSFDPAKDSPSALGRYAASFRQPGFDWRFLTCASDEDLRPILNAYDQWVIRDYDEQGRYLGTMSHLLRVYLIDRQRRIRNIYSVSFLHADTLLNDLRTVALEERQAR